MVQLTVTGYSSQVEGTVHKQRVQLTGRGYSAQIQSTVRR